MKVPDLRTMGPTGFYTAPDRAVLSGHGYRFQHTWAAIPSDGIRYIATEVQEGYSIVVWAAIMSILVDNKGNAPGLASLNIGELDGGVANGLIPMMDSQPAAAGVIGSYGDTLAAGSVKAIETPYNLNGQNVLNGINVFNGPSKTALGLQNKSNAAADVLSVAVLMAIFKTTEVEDFTP